MFRTDGYSGLDQASPEWESKYPFSGTPASQILILNRSTPHTVTGQFPTKLFLGKQIRNCFTLLKPNLNRAVQEKQVKQKECDDGGCVKFHEF